MGHDQHRHACLSDLLNNIKYLTDHLRVECGGRLIKEQNFRFHRECPRNGAPLLLSTRKLSKPLVSVLSQSHSFQQPERFLLSIFPGQSTNTHWSNGDVFQGRHVWEQFELLEDHPDLGPHLG
ncbi:arylesterase [Pseudomonas sp. S31]|nr:arylesterase [Pseudomonas sp. S31]